MLSLRKFIVMKPSKNFKKEIAAKLEAGIKEILTSFNADAATKSEKGTTKLSKKLAKKFSKKVKELEKKAALKEKKQKAKLQKQAIKARKLASKLKESKKIKPTPPVVTKTTVSSNGEVKESVS